MGYLTANTRSSRVVIISSVITRIFFNSVQSRDGHISTYRLRKKVLTGLPMPLISFVYVVGWSNLFHLHWELCVCACCISNFSLIGEKLWCQCQFEVNLLYCTFRFYCTCWLALLIGQVDQVGHLGGLRGQLGHG